SQARAEGRARTEATMMRRRFLMVLLLAAGGAVATGCGDGGGRGAVNPGQPAEPAEPAPLSLKSFVREAFKFDYPASWTVAEKDDSFSIAAPEGAVIKLDIAQPEIDASKALAIPVRHHEKEMTAVTKTEFKQWGKYQGHGLTLQGKYSRLVKATVR